jgi:hypothetical protein
MEKNKVKVEDIPPEVEMVEDEQLIPQEGINKKKGYKVTAMRKSYSELSAKRRSKVNKNVEANVRNYWNQLAPNQSDDELQKCLGSFLPFHSVSDGCVEHATNIAFDCATKKKMEGLQTQIISTFILEKSMTKQKLESIVGSTISARKYSHAKFHAVNCGPGQPLVKVKRSQGVGKRREIVEKFVEFLMERGIETANGRSVSLPGVETYFVPNIKRVEAKQPLIRSFEEQERILLETAVAEGAKRKYVSLRRQSMEDIISMVCPEKHCSLAALDVVGQQHVIQRSGGNRVFTDAEIPEEWQVKQYVCQLSTSVKQKQKAAAGVQVLSCEVKLAHLTSHLKDINDLPLMAKDLANHILGLGVELTTILQKDLKDIVKLAVFTPVCKRAVIEACKKVGRVLPATADVVPALASANEDLDAEIEEEILAQHIHDAEHSYDDLDLE